ncbi:ubiquitin carboxyl-terminal hydrolase 34-like [Tubulanus polymorphus]|uniref:ubiquitin carboxyl-terminal hydrolase 34-like n=1 Tax=Tubulanus polymorphus TaxID=672921 RepID=UPI003DA4CC61
MCDVCTDLLNLLDSHEEKIQGDGLHLSEGEIITVLIYAQAWSQRQCMCCFREVKNFERLNDIVQVILSMSIKTIETIPIEQKKFLEKENNSEKEKAEQKSNESGENEKTKSEDEQKEEKDGADDGDYIWTIDEKDKLLQFVSKLFLMNFPLYMAYKHMVHEEINPQEANALGNYCEVADTEVPLYLLRNVCFFCDTNGIQAIATCFDNGDPATLPFFVAHTLITIIANLRMWMNIPTIMQCIVPLRSHIIRYMCKLSDKDLRMAGLRNMTDLLWAAVKEPLDSQVTFDHEVLDLAFKYFTCSTLTIRLAGVSQMNNQINIYNENCNNESTNDAERYVLFKFSTCIGNKIANWLIDNKLVEHIFGPNLHVEIIKQCQMILNFLAVESRIINEHIDCIWAAAQLKHCSKQVHDILMTLIKNLDIERVQHLLKLVSSLEISSHTEQTLYLAYALIKRIWMSAGGPCPHVAQQPHQSPQYSGAVKEHEEFTKGIQEGVKDSPSNKSDVDVRKRKHDDDEDDDDEESEEGSLLEEEEDEEEGEIRKTKEEGRQGSSPTTSQEFVGSNVETEVYDCGNYLQQFQTHRHRHLQGDFMEDILSPDDGSCNSSHISNKSEKNMADFEGIIHHHNNEDDEDDEEHICSSFSYEDVCKTGHTLLWDLVQEDAACHLPEGLDAEAEKALFSLVCYSTDRRIRMKFIGACIDNLANNTSVVVSLRFLPKLLGSFQQYRSGTEPYNILIWAENKLNMMKHFFNNLIHFSDSVKEGSRPPAHSLYTFRDEVQVRLQFLTGVFSSLGSPDTFRLSLEQVDTLWSCLVINPASTDECLSWFLSQAKSKDHHALGLGAFKHIFLQKMPQLQPENISMIGLNLFQQLCHLARLANNSFDNPLPEDEISGMDQLWGIALKAHNTDVSMSAIQYLNNYYIMYDKVTIGKEEEFIQRCMESLVDCLFFQRPESSLLVIQRALILLKNHLESFRRRYAFHLRIWQLDNQGIISHQKLLQDRQSSMLRVVLQPAGLAEKQSTIEMLSSDLVAELRAEVTRWWESLQKQQKTEKQTPTTGSILTPILGSMLGDGPVRMITLGQELTVDMDEKSLLEIQFKDRQLVFISVGVSRHPRKQDGSTPASYQPAPKREQIPMMILLQEQYFEHLFNLLQELSSLHCPNPEISNNDNQESYTVESKARLLSHKVWELLMLLPTSHSMLHGFKSIMDMKDTQKSESNLRWDKLLNCHSPHKLMYSLQIVESISRPPKHKWRKRGHSGGGDYLPSSDSEDTSDSESNEESWSKKFVAVGGLWHMFHIFLSGCLQSKEGETWNEWNQECLGYLLRLISQFSISQDDLEAVSDDVFDQYDTPRKKMKKQKSNNEKILIPRLNETILSMMEVDAVMKILTTILHDAAVPSDKNQLHSSFARAEVVHYALSFLVSWAYSCEDVHPVLCSPDRLGFWLKRLTLDAPEPHVRREACMGLYRLCHGQTVDGSKKGYCFLLPLLSSLLTFLDYAKKMKPLKTADFHLEDGKDCPKEPYGAGCRDYFWLVCRLVESITKEDAVKSWEESGLVDLNSLASHMANAVVNKDYLEPRINTFEDDALIGLLQLGTSIMKHSPPFKSSVEGREFMAEIFWCLFSLPSVNKRHLPKCKSDASRSATYDLLIELVKGSYDNYVQLHQMVLAQHSKDAHSVYPWDHWPHDDGRSNCGYVGLTNLGATCYMATCMQHLYMIPQARESVLQATVTNDCGKYEGTLTELKKMFAYLLESERKAYNPRGFCKVYTMDKQPLNTGEQKDMTEFFTDLISKLEEMSPELKDVVKTLFGGVLSNNVVSLDCPHVSRTLEEFYTVRCQVADMKNLYESLDEVTVKDTLEGDNMYTCSKCQKKVRAEKRACFKSLPKILCFNTMRYTFNMVTMMKEKVNTHFSFPLRLSMEDYMEHNLIRSDKIRADDEEEDNEKKLEGVQQKDPNEESYEYELTGVTVHTGTADGGHYYSFIRDRLNQSENGQDKWFLFNDAEVKSFDPGQIAGECFGGEMTSKTYDSVTDKFMDFSFEKTNSAYMLFYERIPKNKDMEAVEPSCEEQVKKFNFELSKELADWIWQDNMQFLQDKNIFEHTYFGFMWQMCGYIPTTLPRDDGHQVPLLAAKLSASFVLETLIHAKEKPTMLQWIELLTKQFNSCPAACEWFLDHMANDDWWPQQILIKCPNQVVRQMFHRLIIHVITQLKPAHVAFYLQPLFEREDEVDRTLCNEIEKQSCVTRFIKKMLSITQHGVKPHSKYLSEYFAFFLDFAKMGSEECIFLIQINTISTFINFYMGHKGQDYVEIISDDEEEDDDVIVVTEDKFRPTSLEKMITLISILVEETRVDGREVRLSDKDLNTLVGGKGFPFLFNQIRDNVNLRQTCNLIFSICRWNDRAALTVVQMIFSAITSAKLNQEQSQPFFKVLSMLVEFIGGPPGMPNFTRYVLLKFWEVVEYCPQPCLEWLSAQVTRNKIIHSWVMQHLEHWVELYLIGHNNPRVRNAAAYLLVSLIPSPGFRQAFRSSRHLLSPLKEMNQEAVDVLHAIYEHLLRLLNRARHFVDAATHGTNKLTSYFALMTYCLLSRAEKLMFSQYFMDLWQLFQPKLTEPPISMHHNKQALLIFWHQVCVDCPENVQLIVSNAHVTKNIAFNYILADHDDQEVVIFNRCMLPAYYGILRMCCQQSRSFTRQLAHHQNIQWAFKNITPYPAQYTAAVEELFKMMKLMVLRYPDTSDEELKSINHFKRNTLLLYLQNLDARSNWQTLIPALKTLVENGDDRMLLMYNNGLLMITEAFCTLHMMFHEATACHVTGDIVELLSIFPPVIKMARLFAEKKVGEAKQCLSNWKEKMELIRKLLTLLNSYTPPEVREASLNVLREMVLTFQNDAIQVILPIVISAHVQFQNNTPFAPGPYFPRRGQKAIGGLKSNIRPPRPQFQMLLHSSLLESAKGIDKTYDNALCEFFYPYHQFVDLMCRVAVNQQNLMEQLINLSAMVAYEGVPLHSPYFAKLWYEIYHLEHVDKNCVDILCKSSSFIDYVESILLDERQSLNNQFIFQFFTNYFPRVHQQVLNDNGQALMDNIIQSITIEKLSLENTQCDDDILEITQKINGDLRALRLIFSVQPPKEMDSKLNEALSVILGICKQFQERKHKEKTAQLEVAAQTADETPAKKRKMSIDENKDDEKVEDEKETIERRLDRDSPIPGTSSQKCEIENPDSETEDDAKKGKMDLKKLIPKEKPNSVDVVAKHIESLFEMVNKQKPST